MYLNSEKLQGFCAALSFQDNCRLFEKSHILMKRILNNNNIPKSGLFPFTLDQIINPPRDY